MPRFMDFREEAIRKHHAALGVPCGDVHRVDGLTSS